MGGRYWQVEQRVEQLRNIVNEDLDRKEQCFMTHPGGFRYINRNQIPPEFRPSAICHSYMAGLQYTLPINAQVVQAVEQAGLGPQDVDVPLIHLDPGCYGPKGDCVIKFTNIEAWRMFATSAVSCIQKDSQPERMHVYLNASTV
jgi:hypothetical protein